MNPNEPLGLPHGSVRAIIALLVVGATVLAYLVNGEAAEGLVGIAGAVVAYYFLKRDGEDEEESVPEPVTGDDL